MNPINKLCVCQPTTSSANVDNKFCMLVKIIRDRSVIKGALKLLRENDSHVSCNSLHFTCLSNHHICHLDNNKGLEIKYLNDLFSNFSKKMTGRHNRQTATYIFKKFMAYVRMYECMAEELNK